MVLGALGSADDFNIAGNKMGGNGKKTFPVTMISGWVDRGAELGNGVREGGVQIPSPVERVILF